MIIFEGSNKRYGQNITDYVEHTSQKQTSLLAPFKRSLTENKGVHLSNTENGLKCVNRHGIVISGKPANAMIWVNEEINPFQAVLLPAIIETTKGIVWVPAE